MYPQRLPRHALRIFQASPSGSLSPSLKDDKRRDQPLPKEYPSPPRTSDRIVTVRSPNVSPAERLSAIPGTPCPFLPAGSGSGLESAPQPAHENPCRSELGQSSLKKGQSRLSVPESMRSGWDRHSLCLNPQSLQRDHQIPASIDILVEGGDLQGRPRWRRPERGGTE